MAKDTVTVGSLGQVGYLPDVTPTALPPNGITYTRNFRFNEGQFAEVTSGYSDALASRSNNILGDSETTATFLWTWVLNNDNAFFYYNEHDSGLHYIEENEDGELVDFRLSYGVNYQKELRYDSEGPALANATNFKINHSTNQLTFIDTDVGWDNAVVANAKCYLYDTTSKKALLSSNITAATQSNAHLFTLTLDSDAFMDGDHGTNYQLFIGTEHNHDDQSSYQWSATDALGVPIFNNTLEAPWEFVDTFIPTIRRLTNWPTATTDPTCNYITSFGTQLAAIGYESPSGPVGYQGNKRTIIFSDVIADAGTLPDWDFQQAVDSTSEAAYFDLSLFTDGNVISAVEANNLLYVNTETTVVSISRTGPGTFNGTKLNIGGGVVKFKASTIIPNGFFSIGNGIIYTHDGNSYTEVGNGKWSESWFNAVDDSRLDEIQCIYSPRTHEVWIKTPTSPTAQEIWIYNLNSDTVSVLDDHQEVKYMHWSADGIPANNITWNTIPPEGVTWDTQTQRFWHDFPVLALGEFRNKILSVGGRKMFVHDEGYDFNGRTINAILQQEYQKVTQNAHHTATISRVIPWIESATSQPVSVRVGGSITTAHPTIWTPWKNFTSGTSRKLDFRKNVNWGAIAFMSTTSGDKISGYDIELVTGNRR